MIVFHLSLTVLLSCNSWTLKENGGFHRIASNSPPPVAVNHTCAWGGAKTAYLAYGPPHQPASCVTSVYLSTALLHVYPSGLSDGA
jgi:hypothetical protein